MSWPLMEKLLRHQLSVCSSEGCCVDRLNSPCEHCQEEHIVNYGVALWKVLSDANDRDNKAS